MSDSHARTGQLLGGNIKRFLAPLRVDAAQGYASRYQANQRPLPPPEVVDTEAVAECGVTEAPQLPPPHSSPRNGDLPDRSQEASPGQPPEAVVIPAAEPIFAAMEVLLEAGASPVSPCASPGPHLILREQPREELQQLAVSPSAKSPGAAGHPAAAQSPASSAPQLGLSQHQSTIVAPLGPHAPEYRSSSLPAVSMSTPHSGQLSTREVAAAICPHLETRPRKLSFFRQVGRFMSTKAKASSCVQKR